MAAYQCPACVSNWPQRKSFLMCPACGTRCSYMSTCGPDEDWEDRIAIINDSGHPKHGADVGEEQYRFERFRHAGLGIEQAMDMASNYDVSLHLFEKIVSEGCDAETAARIAG